MLIPACVTVAKSRGLITAAKPIAPWAGEERAVFMCAPIRSDIEAGRASLDEKERQHWAKVEAAFSHFIEGGLVDEKFIKQLLPHKFEHWEIKCRRPKPSVRVFGRFIMPDVFVATHAVLRKPLGGMYSAEFEHEKLVCEDHWRAAGLSDPFSDPAGRYEAYITSNARRKMRIP